MSVARGFAIKVKPFKKRILICLLKQNVIIKSTRQSFGERGLADADVALDSNKPGQLHFAEIKYKMIKTVVVHGLVFSVWPTIPRHRCQGVVLTGWQLSHFFSSLGTRPGDLA